MTIGDQLQTNPALTTKLEEFVAELVAGFGPVPAYYDHMGPLNRAGAGRALPRPARPVTADEVTDAVLSGAWVVDLRNRDAFARAHLPGTVNVEYGTQFATYVGWLVPWDDDLVLLCDHPADISSALHDLAAIGIDGPATHLLTPAAPLSATYRRAEWAEFRDAAGPKSSSTYASATSTTPGTCPARCTCRCTTSTCAATTCPRASSGCTVAPATGLASPPACCTGWAAASCTSTTRGSGSPSWRSRPRSWSRCPARHTPGRDILRSPGPFNRLRRARGASHTWPSRPVTAGCPIEGSVTCP